MKPFLISFNRFHDDRGWFSPQWEQSWMVKYNIMKPMIQTNVAYSEKKNTIRGLHTQNGLTKLVTVIKGSILDVVVNTKGEYVSYVLSGNTPRSLYVPAGCYHGYRTLEDDTIVHYQQDDYYNPKLERGIKWDDKTLNIAWGLDGDPIVSEKDSNLPYWK